MRRPQIEHNHLTRDVKPEGVCPACDAYHESQRGEMKKLKQDGIKVQWWSAPTDIELASGLPTQGLKLVIECNQHDTQLRNKGEILRALGVVLNQGGGSTDDVLDP